MAGGRQRESNSQLILFLICFICSVIMNGNRKKNRINEKTNWIWQLHINSHANTATRYVCVLYWASDLCVCVCVFWHGIHFFSFLFSISIPRIFDSWNFRLISRNFHSAYDSEMANFIVFQSSNSLISTKYSGAQRVWRPFNGKKSIFWRWKRTV